MKVAWTGPKFHALNKRRFAYWIHSFKPDTHNTFFIDMHIYEREDIYYLGRESSVFWTHTLSRILLRMPLGSRFINFNVLCSAFFSFSRSSIRKQAIAVKWGQMISVCNTQDSLFPFTRQSNFGDCDSRREIIYYIPNWFQKMIVSSWNI